MHEEFEFGGWLVRPDRLTLEREGGGEAVRVKPKTMDVLVLLADRSGEVVSRADLLEKVWQNAFVSDDVITQAVAELRRALADDFKSPRLLETVPRRGYRLLPPVRRLDANSRRPTAAHDPVAVDAPAIVRRPAITGMLAAIAAVAIVAAVWLVISVPPGASAPEAAGGATGRAGDGRPTSDTDAYESYLKAQQKYRAYANDPQSLTDALQLARAAVERDPDFAEARTLIGDIQVSRAFWNIGSSDELLIEARREAQAALTTDPSLSLPHAVLGVAAAMIDWQWDAGMREAARATERDPHDARSLSLRSLLSLSCGRTAEAVQLAHRAYELSPIEPNAVGILSWVLYQARQYDEAATFMAKTLETDPNAVFAQNFRPLALAHAGRFDEALAAEEERLRKQGKDAPSDTLGVILTLAGRRQEALALIAGQPANAFPNTRARLGDTSALLQQLDHYLERRMTNYLMWLRTGIKWDPVRQDPHFLRVLAAVGLDD